ncbi:MAG: sulfurtransferase [Pirellulales bacterium]|nr:sulfurtransferase [Pirellulales bacterium]
MKWLALIAAALAPFSAFSQSVPRESYSKPDLLIEPSDLACPDTGRQFVVLDARSREAYDLGHIPGARHVNHDAWKDAFGDGQDREGWGRRIGELGIGPDSKIVVYDDAGMKNAGRVWWILHYWGVNDARLLNGSWRGWQAENLPISKESPEAKPAEFHAEPKAGLLATKQDVLAFLRDPRWQILDSRSRNEYCGIDKAKNKRGGAMPRAKHLEWSDLVDQQTHRFKAPQEIRRLMDQAGIDLARPIATHCQTGGRSSVMAFGLELMGAKDVRNYYRGWNEWGNEESTPVVVPEEGKEKSE